MWHGGRQAGNGLSPATVGGRKGAAAAAVKEVRNGIRRCLLSPTYHVHNVATKVVHRLRLHQQYSAYVERRPIAGEMPN